MGYHKVQACLGSPVVVGANAIKRYICGPDSLGSTISTVSCTLPILFLMDCWPRRP